MDNTEKNETFEKSLMNLYFNERENEKEHTAFDKEMIFYESVKSGDIETVKLLYSPIGGEGYGVLSKNPLQNLKYHLVITIAMLARYCINGGMPMEVAYHISDVLIMQADECTTEEQVHKLHYDALLRYTSEMKKILTRKKYCKHIMVAVDYISNHLHDVIKIQDVAEAVHLSVPYFSKLFHEETGLPFQEYVQIKKIESAKKMLQFSNTSSIEISNILSFSSQSYFIKVFRKYTGMTPSAFKNRFYQDNSKFF